MPLNIQEAPQAPSYAAQSIQVPANIATPQATMNSVKDQQSQLNAVNNLTGGRVRRHRSQRKHKSSVIRTYKGRRHHEHNEQKGGSGAVPDGRIPVPRVGSTCSSGPQCAGAQNASFTAIHNQAQSNSINDAYVQSGGKGKKTRRHQRHKSHRRHDKSLTSIIAYNIKKVMRKVFS